MRYKLRRQGIILNSILISRDLKEVCTYGSGSNYCSVIASVYSAFFKLQPSPIFLANCLFSMNGSKIKDLADFPICNLFKGGCGGCWINVICWGQRETWEDEVKVLTGGKGRLAPSVY